MLEVGWVKHVGIRLGYASWRLDGLYMLEFSWITHVGIQLGNKIGVWLGTRCWSFVGFHMLDTFYQQQCILLKKI